MNQQYIHRLQMAIRQLHNCEATHATTESVKELFRGETIWEGEVEVFDVTGHPRAKRAYAWSKDPGTPHEKFTAILEIPPVRSAVDAVRVSLMVEARKGTE